MEHPAKQTGTPESLELPRRIFVFREENRGPVGVRDNGGRRGMNV